MIMLIPRCFLSKFFLTAILMITISRSQNEVLAKGKETSAKSLTRKGTTVITKLLELKVQLQEGEPESKIKIFRMDDMQYEVRVLDATTKKEQKIELRNAVHLSKETVSFVDLNGDGLKDLVIVGGQDKREKNWFKIWHFNPKTRQFVWPQT